MRAERNPKENGNGFAGRVGVRCGIYIARQLCGAPVRKVPRRKPMFGKLGSSFATRPQRYGTRWIRSSMAQSLVR